MKVLMINANLEGAPYPVSPLGMCMVATALGRAGHEVIAYDGYPDGGLGLPDLLASGRPDVVGMSVRNIDDVVMERCSYYVEDIGRRFVEPVHRYGRAPLVLGGAGFSVFPEALVRLWSADYGVVGEGEAVFPALLEALAAGRSPVGLPGVLSRAGDVVTGGRVAAAAGALRVPRADVDRHIAYDPYRARGSYPIQTKRGCARKCLYCAYPAIEGASYRLRSAADVVDEVEEVTRRLGGVPFEIVDSTFNDPPGHAEGICREVVRRGLNLRLRTMGVNPGGVTRELLELMRWAGFAQIDCTPDTASPVMLSSLRKGFTREKLDETARLVAEVGMPTMWFFVLGGPGESEATLRETFGFIDRFVDERDLVHLTEGLRIYPGTGLHEVALREGLVGAGDDLLRPAFYVSRMLGRVRLAAKVAEFCGARHNCLRAAESTPSPEMIREALELRAREGLDEPMFRTLLRIRRASLASGKRQ